MKMKTFALSPVLGQKKNFKKLASGPTAYKIKYVYLKSCLSCQFIFNTAKQSFNLANNTVSLYKYKSFLGMFV